jgi:hypothetical protein
MLISSTEISDRVIALILEISSTVSKQTTYLPPKSTRNRLTACQRYLQFIVDAVCINWCTQFQLM